MGKLADRLGRKPVYLTAIALFGIGSLLCGLSQDVGSFGMLIAARSLQAIGGGGILPIATAEIGTEVPEERRGLALGLVGAVFGIANLLGASAGSLILDIAGQHNWQWIFYINVPIAAMIVIAGWVVLPNHRESRVAKLDLVGIAILVAMIMSLLYGLTNIDFFDLSASVTSLEVYPFLIAFVVLLPVFVLAERRAEDPVLNLDYFTNRPIALTLAASFLSGFILMGVVFVPQLAENALELPSGSGGYLVILLGLASGVGAPLSGRLTDAFGPKLVLAIGGGVSALAAVSVVTWLIPHPGYPSVIVSLVLIGLGLGFVIGSPLNYLMLRLTDPAQSNSALGTLSLVRSIGTTLAPVIMVGFLAHAGGLVQDRLTADLPSTIKAPELPYAASLQKKFAAWKADDRFSDALKGVEFPDLSSKTTIEVNTDGGGELPDELVTLLQDADVTTIVSDTKTIAKYMFAQQTPAVIADITKGVETGIDQLGTVHDKLGTTATTMTKNIAKMTTALAKMRTGLAKLDATVDSMSTAIDKQGTAIAGMTKGINGMTKGIDGMNTARAKQAKAIAGMTTAINGMTKGIDGMDKALAKQAKAIARHDHRHRWPDQRDRRFDQGHRRPRCGHRSSEVHARPAAGRTRGARSQARPRASGPDRRPAAVDRRVAAQAGRVAGAARAAGGQARRPGRTALHADRPTCGTDEGDGQDHRPTRRAGRAAHEADLATQPAHGGPGRDHRPTRQADRPANQADRPAQRTLVRSRQADHRPRQGAGRAGEAGGVALRPGEGTHRADQGARRDRRRPLAGDRDDP